MKKYNTVVADNVQELDNKVNRALKDGWELYGSPYAVSHPKAGNVLICQAMLIGEPDAAQTEKKP